MIHEIYVFNSAAKLKFYRNFANKWARPSLRSMNNYWSIVQMTSSLELNFFTKGNILFVMKSFLNVHIVVVADESENGWLILKGIETTILSMDLRHKNVSELDITVFFRDFYIIIDEIFSNGQISELSSFKI